MTWTGKELLSAYREQQGPDEDAVARLLARADAMGEPAAEVVDADIDEATHGDRSGAAASVWQMRAGVAVAALAAAAVLGWWIRGEVATPAPARTGSLASDRADPATVSGETKVYGEARGPSTHRGATPPPSGPPEVLVPAIVPGAEVGVPGESISTPATSAPARKRRALVRPQSPSATEASPPDPDPPAVDTELPGDSLAAETIRIGRARASLSKGQAGQAVALLRNYDSVFPNGALGEEADAIRTMARCRLAPSAAQSLRTEFLKRHPKSLFRAQVGSGCVELASVKKKSELGERTP